MACSRHAATPAASTTGSGAWTTWSGAHGVTPGIEHNGYTVDMLGRVGRLDEVEELVAVIPMAPDTLVRGSCSWRVRCVATSSEWRG